MAPPRALQLVSMTLDRRKERVSLGIKQVDEDGRATQVTIVQDSLKDELVAGHAYFAFKDAQYLPARAEPVFTYVFRPPK